MKDCAYFEVQISGYLDDMLTEEEIKELMEHLACCPDCSALFADLTKLSNELQQLPAAVPSEDFASTVIQQVKRKRGTKRAAHRSLIGVAAVLVVTLIGLGTMRLLSSNIPSQSAFTEGATISVPSESQNGTAFGASGEGEGSTSTQDMFGTPAPEEAGTGAAQETDKAEEELTGAALPQTDNQSQENVTPYCKVENQELPIGLLPILDQIEENEETFFAILTVGSTDETGLKVLNRQAYASFVSQLEEENATFSIQTSGIQIDPLSDTALVIYYHDSDSEDENSP